MSKQQSIYNVENAVAIWDFRANENSYSCNELKDFLPQVAKKWCFQLEEGDTTGYRHWQGRISLWKKKRGGELAKLWMKQLELPQYIQPTAAERDENNKPIPGTVKFSYVMKLDTRIEGPWTDKDAVQFVPRQYQTTGLRPWQQKIIDSGEVFDTRKVDLIVDNKGNHGKSFIAGYVHLNKLGIKVPPVNNPQDLIQAVMNMCMAKDTHNPKLIFMDLPRAQNKEKLAGMYNAVEQIKEGFLYDFRYQFKEWWIDSPRIWVFTNAMPDIALLSEDRWNIWHIYEHELVAVKP